MGGEFGGEWIHVYVQLKSLHCSPQTITMLLISYTPIWNKKLRKKSLHEVSQSLQTTLCFYDYLYKAQRG